MPNGWGEGFAMGKKAVSLMAILLLLLSGCTKSLTTSEEKVREDSSVKLEDLDAVKEALKKLEGDLVEKDSAIKELQTTLESTKTSQLDRIVELENKVHMQEVLLAHLPAIVHKQGYIKEIKRDGTQLFFVIDYAAWEQDPNAPNGGKLVNEKEEQELIAVSESIAAYVLNGAAVPVYDPFKEFEEKSHSGLFNLYLVEGEIVLISEQYLP
jgi:uncharacterized coiled-coil protein SlyX